MQAIVSAKAGSLTWQQGVSFAFRRHVPSGAPGLCEQGCQVDVLVHANLVVSVRRTDDRALLSTGRCDSVGVSWDQPACPELPATALEMLAQDVSDLLFAFERRGWLLGSSWSAPSA